MDLSFQINHTTLLPGIYVSRKDIFDDTVITTFDLRFKKPNREPVMDMPVMHSFEHLGAIYLRTNEEWASRTIYFGPMGCRTGFYVIFEGDLSPQDILPLMKKMLDWILAYEGDVIGAKPKECGNWREHNLEMAQFETRLWAEVLKNAGPQNFVYPESN